MSDSRIHFAGPRTWGNRYPHPRRWTLSYVIRPRHSQLSPKPSRIEKLEQLGEGEPIAGHTVGYQRKGRSGLSARPRSSKIPKGVFILDHTLFLEPTPDVMSPTLPKQRGQKSPLLFWMLADGPLPRRGQARQACKSLPASLGLLGFSGHRFSLFACSWRPGLLDLQLRRQQAGSRGGKLQIGPRGAGAGVGLGGSGSPVFPAPAGQLALAPPARVPRAPPLCD